MQVFLNLLCIEIQVNIQINARTNIWSVRKILPSSIYVSTYPEDLDTAFNGFPTVCRWLGITSYLVIGQTLYEPLLWWRIACKHQAVPLAEAIGSLIFRKDYRGDIKSWLYDYNMYASNNLWCILITEFPNLSMRRLVWISDKAGSDGLVLDACGPISGHQSRLYFPPYPTGEQAAT
jgi:hypothetical protein